MDAFGDVSGHFRNLLSAECEVAVVGVALGDGILAGRCPKQTVRNVTDIAEARWNDLTDVQKRRFIDCIADEERLDFGYAKFTRDQLHSLKNHYLLHQVGGMSPAWDLALTGYAYGEILFEAGARDETRNVFKLDRVGSKPQSQVIADHISQFIPNVNPFIEGSRKSAGIQAADCFAGAVAEDHKRGTDWLSEISDDRIVRAGSTALIQLESDLYAQGS